MPIQPSIDITLTEESGGTVVAGCPHFHSWVSGASREQAVQNLILDLADVKLEVDRAIQVAQNILEKERARSQSE